MWCNWNTNGFFGWWMVTLWGVILAVVVSASRSTRKPPTGFAALEILKNRYAAGEIDHQEFEERRRLLDPSSGTDS